MDPVTLATATLTILTPFAKDAGKELVKTVGEIGFEKAKDLFTWLKHRFATDPVASADLSRFESDPVEFESGLRASIKKKVQDDPEFAGELQKRIDEIGPVITVFQDIKNVKEAVGVDVNTIRSGKVGVTQAADNVDKVTGLRANNIGK
jgi:hypothetical protein